MNIDEVINHMNNRQMIIHNDIRDIKQKQDKWHYIILAIAFLAGIAIGTQYKSWTPYVHDIGKAIDVIKIFDKGAN